MYKRQVSENTRWKTPREHQEINKVMKTRVASEICTSGRSTSCPSWHVPDAMCQRRESKSTVRQISTRVQFLTPLFVSVNPWAHPLTPLTHPPSSWWEDMLNDAGIPRASITCVDANPMTVWDDAMTFAPYFPLHIFRYDDRGILSRQRLSLIHI